MRNGSTILPATQAPEKVAAQARYRDVRRSLEPILSGIRRDIRGAIRSLGDPDLIRYELRWRIKRFGSVERKGRERAKPVSEILAKAEDLIGFRAVCSNLQDVQRAAKVIAAALRLKHLDVRVHDYVSRPKFDGYRAVHLVVKVPLGPNAPVPQIGCEIQIRSLLQNAWAEQSRYDLYKPTGAENSRISVAMRRLSARLAEADATANQLRRDFARRIKGRRPPRGRRPTAEALAFLYSEAFGADPPEYLINGVLQEVRRSRIRLDGLAVNLNSKNVRKRVKAIWNRRLGVAPGPKEVFRTIVRAEAESRSPLAIARSDVEGELEYSKQYVWNEFIGTLPDDWGEIVSNIERARSDKDDGAEYVLELAAGFGCSDRSFWDMEPVVEVDALAHAIADHYRLHGRKWEKAVEQLEEVIRDTGVREE